MTGIHVCIGALEDCQNPQESYGEICVQCNKCGRFDAEGSSSEETLEEADQDTMMPGA